jgi:hypothetical protein
MNIDGYAKMPSIPARFTVQIRQIEGPDAYIPVPGPGDALDFGGFDQFEDPCLWTQDNGTLHLVPEKLEVTVC